jgi:uncharacterized protein
MPDTAARQPGRIGWFDLTVADAPQVRDFYRKVVGWKVSEVDMGGYADYCLHVPGSGEVVAGLCHARGENADLPPAWLLYITVADLDESLRQCEQAGGQVRVAPRSLGPPGRFAVIEDPAGAVAALFEPA